MKKINLENPFFFVLVAISLLLLNGCIKSQGTQELATVQEDKVIFPGDGAGHGHQLSYSDPDKDTFTDNNTGWMWEMKDSFDKITNYNNPHDADNKYTWGMTGSTEPDGTLFTDFLDKINNTCDGDEENTRCSTNADCQGIGNGLCGHAGHRDWCIPDVKKLQSIVDYGTSDPAASFDGDYGADMNKGGLTWSSTSLPQGDNRAWAVSFGAGVVNKPNKTSGTLARAVRPCLASCEAMTIDNGSISACNHSQSCPVTCADGFEQYGDDPTCTNGRMGLIPQCGQSCVIKGRCLVFVTNLHVEGSRLSDHFKAQDFPNNLCHFQATAAGIKGVFKPWLSGTEQGIDSDFTQATVPYFRTDGVKIADNWEDLTQCDGNNNTGPCLDAPINKDQFIRTVYMPVWTGTTIEGAPSAYNCGNWQSNNVGFTGESSSSDHGWTQSNYGQCSTKLPIYCFEQ